MSQHARKKYFSYLIYVILLVVISWQGISLLQLFRSSNTTRPFRNFHVRIDGDVRRPGLYAVPEGTTEFEILQVAGVRLTSDISGLSLSGQIEDNATYNIGSLEKPITVESSNISAHLEFFIGEMSIIANDGRSTPQHEGLAIAQGDRIQTEASAQAEISIGQFSRVDIDNFSELIFDKIGAQENDQKITELIQKSGACWYKAVLSSKNSEIFKVVSNTISVTVGGSGADFLIDILNDQIQINLMDGLLLLERTNTGEALNIISGQSVTIFNDGRPFQVTRLTQDLGVNERFNQLSREKIDYIARQMPFNFLFCAPPGVFFFVSIQYETGICHVVKIPPSLIIDQFSQGISTLDQAFLYGGPVFASTFVERVMDIRISKHCVFSKDALIRTAGALGGISTTIDNKAASALKIAAGQHKILGNQLVQLISPKISGVEDSQNRQANILKSIFTDFRNKNIPLTVLLTDQILTNIETNFTTSEVMEQFSKFNQHTDWQYKEHTLPANETKRGKKVCYDPILEKCKVLLN